MKIFGDETSSKFKNYAKEPGVFFGSHDVLKGTRATVNCCKISFFGTSNYSKTVEPKLYLHIPTNAWTRFTGKIREYLLPWRWKTAYLDQEDSTQPRQILVCTSPKDSELSDRLSKLLNKSWFLTNLININHYDEIFGKEFICLPGEKNPLLTITITHPLGKMMGICFMHFTNELYCHIYRPRSSFSTLRYNILKKFSSSWKEVAIQAGQVSEKVLIKKSDEAVISRSGLIV